MTMGTHIRRCRQLCVKHGVAKEDVPKHSDEGSIAIEERQTLYCCEWHEDHE